MNNHFDTSKLLGICEDLVESQKGSQKMLNNYSDMENDLMRQRRKNTILEIELLKPKRRLVDMVMEEQVKEKSKRSKMNLTNFMVSKKSMIKKDPWKGLQNFKEMEELYKTLFGISVTINKSTEEKTINVDLKDINITLINKENSGTENHSEKNNSLSDHPTFSLSKIEGENEKKNEKMKQILNKEASLDKSIHLFLIERD